MKNLYILISFDVESPYGKYGLSDAGRQERIFNLAYIENLSNLLNSYKIKRTYFILGDYLLQGKEQLGKKYLKKVFEPENPLIEIAQHTYSHGTVIPIVTRPDRTPMTREQFKDELKKTNEVIKNCLDVVPDGVRMPLGYVNGFKQHPDLTKIIKDCGLLYVNADSRSPSGDVCLPLSVGKKERQPYFYPNGLLEIPAHGWHDTVFSGKTKTSCRHNETAWDSSKIAKALSDVIESAENLHSSEDFYLSISFHPWSMRLYDPELRIFKNFINKIKKNSYTTLTHSDLFSIYSTD
ncbi:putative Polysaccharide deacetylase family protein [Candidatus Magnetomoraceae bacterium gMMP-1]